MNEKKKAVVTNWTGTLSGEETDERVIKHLGEEITKYITSKESNNYNGIPLTPMKGLLKGSELGRRMDEVEGKAREYRRIINLLHERLSDAVVNAQFRNSYRDEIEDLEIEEGMFDKEDVREGLEVLDSLQEKMIGVYNKEILNRVSKGFVEEKLKEYAESEEVQNSLQKGMIEKVGELNENGYYTGIISPTPTIFMEQVLTDLEDYENPFDFIYGSELESDPRVEFNHVDTQEKEEAIERIMDEAGVEKENIITVVDDLMEAPLIENSGRSFLSPCSLKNKNKGVLSGLSSLYDIEGLENPEELLEKLKEQKSSNS